MVAWRLVLRGWGGLGSSLSLLQCCVLKEDISLLQCLTFSLRGIFTFLSPPLPPLPLSPSPPLSPPPPNPLTLWKAAFVRGFVGILLKEIGNILNCLHTNFKGWLGEGGGGKEECCDATGHCKLLRVDCQAVRDEQSQSMTKYGCMGLSTHKLTLVFIFLPWLIFLRLEYDFLCLFCWPVDVQF